MHFKPCFSIIIVASLINICLAGNYRVAVIEYEVNANFSETAENALQTNTNNYLKLIQEIHQNNTQVPVDLIIFSELTLSPLTLNSATSARLPKSSDIVLCNSSDDFYLDFLKQFSCSAIQYNTTIVINLTEKDVCEEESCSNLSEIFYNTNVAFGPNGSIIARYRKYNLFGEYGKSKPDTLDLPVLDIRNTTFGLMTCFDIQFGIPAFNLTREKAVQNIIFPLRWISELPYLTALQTQQMWAQEFNVVLLASGASQPRGGAGGSGIFFGKQGPLVNDILPVSGTKVMTRTVSTNISDAIDSSYETNDVNSIDKLAASMDDFFMLVDPSIKDHSAVVLNVTENVTNTQVCHGENQNRLCCNFNITISTNTSDLVNNTYIYHLVAFNGVRTYSGLYYGGVETCGVVACLNDAVASCGQRFRNYSSIHWPVTFESISVTGNFTSSETYRIQYPTTLVSSIRPLSVREYEWTRKIENSKIIRNLTLTKPQSRLLTFGIFGRDYSRDWDPIRNNSKVDNNSSNSIHKTGVIFIIVMVLFKVQ